MDSVILTRVISALLMPPLNLYLLAALGGVLLMLGWRRSGRTLVSLSLVLLFLLSTPAVAYFLLNRLQAGITVLKEPRATQAQAIVILGGSRQIASPEYGGRDIPAVYALGRLRYGAWLHEQTGLPILVSGGSPERRPESEASIMARALRESFKVPVRWLEDQSDNTEQNARNSARILKAAGVQRILLVSDAWHLPRALPMFADQGLQVTAAPTNFNYGGGLHFMQRWLPQAPALTLSYFATREWVGQWWYRGRRWAESLQTNQNNRANSAPL